MEITFAGNKKLKARINGFEIMTDQPAGNGGEGTAPTPYELFLASLGTCAGIFAVGFLKSRGLSPEGFKIDMDMDMAAHKLNKVTMKVTTPKDFPVHYAAALIKAMELCAVKKALADPPEFEINVKDF